MDGWMDGWMDRVSYAGQREASFYVEEECMEARQGFRVGQKSLNSFTFFRRNFQPFPCRSLYAPWVSRSRYCCCSCFDCPHPLLLLRWACCGSSPDPDREKTDRSTVGVTTTGEFTSW